MQKMLTAKECKFNKLQNQARYRNKNRTMLAKDSKAYYRKHKVAHYLACKNWRKKNRKKFNQISAIWQRKNWLKTAYYHLHRDAKRRGINFKLQFSTFSTLRVKACFYCQKVAAKSYGGGLDRIDNEKGYIENNVLPCCGNCNRLRCDVLSVDEAKRAITAVLEYRAVRGVLCNGLQKFVEIY